MTSPEPAARSVTADIDVQVTLAGRLIYQVAVVRRPGLEVAEEVALTVDGRPVPWTEVVGVTGSRLMIAEPGVGRVQFAYRATVRGQADPPEIRQAELVEHLRPSRYAESDKLAKIAAAEFGHLSRTADLLGAVAAWVGDHLTYVSGSSDPIDGAVDTYLLGRGVCRDYAHLVVAFLRARNVPARLVTVYAPGLYPMDFHAVAEAFVDGIWRIVDGTLLAPRASMVRIATGRDAADTSFLDSFGGTLALISVQVSAVVMSQYLPPEDPRQLVTLG